MSKQSLSIICMYKKYVTNILHTGLFRCDHLKYPLTFIFSEYYAH